VSAIAVLGLLCFLLSSFLYFFSYAGVDNDLWGHLYFGREILQSGKLPSQNLYSYTAPDHTWINHEWLGEVIFYWFFYRFGSPGLILLKLAVGGGVIWVLNLIIKKEIVSFFARVLTLVWAMAILSPGFNVRPQIFTYILFATILFLFYRFERGSKNIIYWTPFLMVLWVNLHGGFVAGLGALALFSLWIAIRGLRNGDAIKESLTHVFIPAMLALPALALNPYGVDLLSFLAGDLLLDRPITEWNPIPLLDFSFLEFKLAVLFVLLFSLRRDSWRRWDFALTILAAVFAFRHQRHIPLFAIAAAPIMAVGLQQIYVWVEKRVREWLLAAVLLAMAVYYSFWIGKTHWEHKFQLVVSPLDYPTQAADYLQRNGVQGNMVVPFDWGEYLIWKLYPAVRVSIDGRYTTAYPMNVIQSSWEWMEGKKEWKRVLENYPTEVAITNRDHPVTSLLRKDPEWVYIYSDPISFIFVRNTYSQQELLEKFKNKLLVPPQSPPIYFPG